MKRLVLGIAMISLFACGGGDKKPSLDDVLEDDNKEVADDKKGQDTEEFEFNIDPNILDTLLNSIPPPLEMAFLIKEVGSNYDNTYLNTLTNLDNYSSDYQKAVNLGIYGADLAYTNLYNSKDDGIAYLGGVRTLAKDLNIDKFFDVEVITNLINNSNNLDSLLILTTSNFEKINVHLQKQKRSHLSALLLIGGWLEGLNLACQVQANNPNKDLKEKIGEQKEGLKQILKLLKYFEKNDYMKSLVQDLKGLEKEFGRVKKTVEKRGTEEVDMGGWFMTVDKSITIIEYSDEDFKAIADKAASIRKKIIE